MTSGVASGEALLSGALAGSVALVTGGATGLGRATALALAERGAEVAIAYWHSVDEARAMRTSMTSKGQHAEIFQADLSQPRAPQALVSNVFSHFGRLDVLVNNAGMTTRVPFSNIEALTEDAWEQTLAVNLSAPFLCARAARALMNPGSSIVNVASAAGLHVRGSSIAYAVSKAGLIHLSRCLALAFAPDIRVNVVAPADVASGWHERTGALPNPSRLMLPVSRVVAEVLALIEDPQRNGEVVELEAVAEESAAEAPSTHANDR